MLTVPSKVQVPKEAGDHWEAGKSKKMDSPLEPPEKKTALEGSLILALNPILDF